MPEDIAFLTTLGREFCDVLRTEAGIDDLCGADCYSVLSEALESEVTASALVALQEPDYRRISDEFNAFLERTSVTHQQVATAVLATLSHWEG